MQLNGASHGGRAGVAVTLPNHLVYRSIRAIALVVKSSCRVMSLDRGKLASLEPPDPELMPGIGR